MFVCDICKESKDEALEPIQIDLWGRPVCWSCLEEMHDRAMDELCELQGRPGFYGYPELDVDDEQ